MGILSGYKIDVKNVRGGIAEYRFALDDTFFEAMGGILVKGGKATADLKIRERGAAYAFTFHIKGTVRVPCDKCLDDMDVEIETERELTMKPGDGYADDGDTVTFPREDSTVDVAWVIYELAALEVPLTHVHEAGHCNAETEKALAAHLVASSGEPNGSEEKADAGAGEEHGQKNSRRDELKGIRATLDNN